MPAVWAHSAAARPGGECYPSAETACPAFHTFSARSSASELSDVYVRRLSWESTEIADEDDRTELPECST